MPYLGIGIDPKIEDPDFEEPNKVSTLSGAYESAKESFLSNPEANMLGELETDKAEIEHPGKWLTENNWKTSTYFRKGLSFPHGVSEAQARISAQNIDSEEKSQELIDNMNNGIIPASARFIGNALGFAASPSNIAATMLAPELIGDKASLTAFKMADLAPLSSARLLSSQVSRGAIEGAAVLAPGELTEDQKNTMLGQTPDVFNTLMSIGEGAAIGGVIHGAVASHAILSREGFNAARQTAVDQSMNDQDINVSNVVKQGFNEARASEPIKNIPEAKYEQLDDEIKDDIGTRHPTFASERDFKDHFDAEQEIAENPRVDVDLQDVKATMQKTGLPENDNAFLGEELPVEDASEMKLTDEDESDIEELKSQVEALKEQGAVSDDDVLDTKAIEDTEDQWEKLRPRLHSYINCILEAGDE